MVSVVLPVKMYGTWRDKVRSDRRLKRTDTGTCRSLYSGSSVTTVATGNKRVLITENHNSSILNP